MHCNTGGGVITNEMFVVVVVGNDDSCDRQHCDSGGDGGGAPGRHQTRDSDVIDHVSSNHFLQQQKQVVKEF